jgi:NAD kinase
MAMTKTIWIMSKSETSELGEMIKGAGMRLDEHAPDVVITYGGDGTLLASEARYPGIPKLPIRESKICAKCSNYSLDQIPKILPKVLDGRFKIEEKSKIEASIGEQRLVGLNEVQIHSKIPIQALRFSIEMGKTKVDEIIGDGLVAATPHGSTGYYRSIGYKPFDKGMRIGFNNIWPPMKPVELTEPVKIKIIRENGWLAADNQNPIELRQGDIVEIRKSEQKARIIKV